MHLQDFTYTTIIFGFKKTYIDNVCIELLYFFALFLNHVLSPAFVSRMMVGTITISVSQFHMDVFFIATDWFSWTPEIVCSDCYLSLVNWNKGITVGCNTEHLLPLYPPTHSYTFVNYSLITPTVKIGSFTDW